jgi:hypothetical protein
MNRQRMSPTRAASQAVTGSTRLHERWTVPGRVAWLALIVLILGSFIGSFPAYLAQLHTLCVGVGVGCSYWQLTSEQVRVLNGIGWSFDGYVASMVAFTLVSGVLYLLLSALLIWRRPDDRMALLVALLFVSFSTSATADLVSVAQDSLWQIPNKGLITLWNALVVLIFSLFPSGQFVPRWTRWTLIACFAGLIPYAIFSRDTPLHQLGWLLLLSEQLIVVAAQLYRYRRVSRPLERQQTKWVAFCFMVPAALFVGGEALSVLFPTLYDPGSPAGAPYQLALTAIGVWALLFFPLSLGMAVLRYRLWEIDRLVNKALVYGLLTSLLVAIYAGLILGLESLAVLVTGQEAQPVVIVVSTLVIAALFQPLRQRLQHLIDRRFYRQKYHAEKILVAFSGTLRNQVGLEQIREQLLAAVQETMQPASLSLWICPMKPQTVEVGTREEAFFHASEQPGAENPGAL